MADFVFDQLYNYHIPSNLIGVKPEEKRDRSKLFVYNTKTNQISFDIFSNIHKYLPKDSLMIVNETKVIPARIILHKSNGNKVEVLFLLDTWDRGEFINIMPDRKIVVGDQLNLNSKFYFDVIDQDKNIFKLKLKFRGDLLKGLLEEFGTVPIPKYIKGIDMDSNKLKSRYQSVFAKTDFSIAAPTASLHFTNEVFEKVKENNIKIDKISLNIGLGTFKPVTEENIKTNRLHEEGFFISKETIKDIVEYKKNNKNIIAVGTTSVRTLESFANSLNLDFPNKKMFDYESKTNIFIKPPFKFNLVDTLITNFHLPNSSLMMLVEAFLQYKKSNRHVKDLYTIAIKENFKFFSFGDSMLII